jgi:hypothetical protein
MNTDSNVEISALRNQIFVQLVALVIITGTLTVYLYRQASMAQKQSAQAQQVITAYEQAKPALEAFVSGLVAYGEQHPDFTQQVLKKYGIAPIPGIPASAPAPKK